MRKLLLVIGLALTGMTNAFAYDFQTTVNDVEMQFTITSSEEGMYGYPEVELTKVLGNPEKVVLPKTVNRNILFITTGTYAITSIGTNAFAPENGEYSNLSSFEVEKGSYLTKICARAFNECVNLRIFPVWNNLENIVADAFTGSGIEEFAEPEGCRNTYKAQGQCLVDRDTETRVMVFAPKAGPVVLNEKVNKIEAYAASCSDAKTPLKVVFTCPGPITIAARAFSQSSLVTLQCTNGGYLDEIEQGAFEHCFGFYRIKFDGGHWPKISEQAFSNSNITVIESTTMEPNSISSAFIAPQDRYTSEKAYLLVPNGAKKNYVDAGYGNKFVIYEDTSGSDNVGNVGGEDVNGDGKVNATDVMQIYNYILSH